MFSKVCCKLPPKIYIPSASVWQTWNRFCSQLVWVIISSHCKMLNFWLMTRTNLSRQNAKQQEKQLQQIKHAANTDADTDTFTDADTAALALAAAFDEWAMMLTVLGEEKGIRNSNACNMQQYWIQLNKCNNNHCVGAGNGAWQALHNKS